jgi:hypothetical protein
MSDLDIAVSVALGIGLAAATGLRVFLPLLVVSAAAYSGHLPLADSFAWLGTPAALILLRRRRHRRDPRLLHPGRRQPARRASHARGAGRWDGGLSRRHHRSAADGEMGHRRHCRRRHRRSDAERDRACSGRKSTVFTAGVGNPVLATSELGGSLLVSLLALAAPLIALLLVVLFLWLALRLLLRVTRRSPPAPEP